MHVQRLQDHLARVADHLNDIRKAQQAEWDVIHRELESAWHRFLDAFAEASRQNY